MNQEPVFMRWTRVVLIATPQQGLPGEKASLKDTMLSAYSVDTIDFRHILLLTLSLFE